MRETKGVMTIHGSGVYQIAKALFLHHGFDPDVAVSAAHCYVRGTFPTVSYAQAMAHFERVKRVPSLTTDDVDEILAAYLDEKI
jgi:hypothetical protein